MFRERLRQAVSHVGQALHEPEAFAWRWHSERRPYSSWVFLALGATAVLGTTTYGMTMGLFGGVGRMLQQGAAYSLAAGIAWSLPLPALYILNSLSGSRLRPSTTLLAARDNWSASARSQPLICARKGRSTVMSSNATSSTSNTMLPPLSAP